MQYGRWRDDKEAEPGHSRELVSVNTAKEFYDNLAAQPHLNKEGEDRTLMDAFKRQARTRGNEPFLGVRQRIGTDENGKPIMGDYSWETYSQVDQQLTRLAHGMLRLDLAPEVEGEGRQWRFIGIWAQNRPEWAKTLLACMHFKATTVGFYDAMGAQQVDFILRQTELSTIFCTANYA